MIPNILNAIEEIKAVEFDHSSDWLEVLKESAIDAVRENDSSLINDDDTDCEMTDSEYVDFVAATKKEMFFHDEWDRLNLERRIVRNSKECVDAWNKIIEILIDHGVGKVSKNWLMEATDSDELIDKFCHYDLPSDAVVGGEWQLPKWYINSYATPEAPRWDFDFPEFTSFIKSVKSTDDSNVVEVEYYVYRSNKAHCDGYYALWDSGKAMVNVNTHRRWNAE